MPQTIRLAVYSVPAEPNTAEQARRETEVMNAVDRVSPDRHYENGECVLTWNLAVRDSAFLGLVIQRTLRLEHVDRIVIT